MSFRRGDLVEQAGRNWDGIVMFQVVSFLKPPSFKPERDVRLRVVWKRSPDPLPSWPIGTTTVTCETRLREPDNAMLVLAVAASLPKRWPRA